MPKIVRGLKPNDGGLNYTHTTEDNFAFVSPREDITSSEQWLRHLHDQMIRRLQGDPELSELIVAGVGIQFMAVPRDTAEDLGLGFIENTAFPEGRCAVPLTWAVLEPGRMIVNLGEGSSDATGDLDPEDAEGFRDAVGDAFMAADRRAAMVELMEDSYRWLRRHPEFRRI